MVRRVDASSEMRSSPRMTQDCHVQNSMNMLIAIMRGLLFSAVVATLSSACSNGTKNGGPEDARTVPDELAYGLDTAVPEVRRPQDIPTADMDGGALEVNVMDANSGPTDIEKVDVPVVPDTADIVPDTADDSGPGLPDTLVDVIADTSIPIDGVGDIGDTVAPIVPDMPWGLRSI